MQVALEAVQHTTFLSHQVPTTARQSLEDVVFLWRCSHFLEHILGQRQVITKLEEFEALARIEGIGLGCSREYLLEPGQLQVVNVVKTVVLCQTSKLGLPWQFHQVNQGVRYIITLKSQFDRALAALIAHGRRHQCVREMLSHIDNDPLHKSRQKV